MEKLSEKTALVTGSTDGVGRLVARELGGGVELPPEEASMERATTIGLDIAKHMFQVHGADAAGHVLFRKRITRAKLLGFLAAQTRCVVAMEACAGAHYWAREIAKLGHHVRLIAPAYVKPFIKRQKNDAADAEAICEAAQRPSMRFVPVKTEEQQANGIVFRARDLLVRQRTQCVNAENDVGTGSSQTLRWRERDAHPRSLRLGWALIETRRRIGKIP
jgi:hypothetical protein